MNQLLGNSGYEDLKDSFGTVVRVKYIFYEYNAYSKIDVRDR